MYCRNCKNKIKSSANFCGKCGASVNNQFRKNDKGGIGAKICMVVLLSIITFATIYLLTGKCLWHKWQYISCTSPMKCSKCGQSKDEIYGHKWVDATCTTGEMCELCGTVRTDALGHDWQPATCTTVKKCKVCGIEEGELGHEWLNATCNRPKTCSKCGQTEGEQLEHDWMPATCTTPATCKLCASTDGYALGHEFQKDKCTVEYCKRCGYSQSTGRNHSFANGVCTVCNTIDESYKVQLSFYYTESGIKENCEFEMINGIPIADEVWQIMPYQWNETATLVITQLDHVTGDVKIGYIPYRGGEYVYDKITYTKSEDNVYLIDTEYITYYLDEYGASSNYKIIIQATNAATHKSEKIEVPLWIMSYEEYCDVIPDYYRNYK